MKQFYLDTFKNALAKPNLSKEELEKVMEDTDFFLQVTRVKLESRDPAVRQEAARELSALRELLQSQFVIV